MKSALGICVVAGLASAPVLADQIELTAPMQGATLHEGGIDMSVYFLDVGGTFEVVATYIDTAEPYDPARLKVALADGESVHLALPERRHVIYAFTRSNGTVQVSAERNWAEVDQAVN